MAATFNGTNGAAAALYGSVDATAAAEAEFAAPVVVVETTSRGSSGGVGVVVAIFENGSKIGNVVVMFVGVLTCVCNGVVYGASGVVVVAPMALTFGVVRLLRLWLAGGGMLRL